MNTEKVESCFQMIGARVVDYKLHNDFVSIDGNEKKKLDMTHTISQIGKNSDDCVLGIMQLTLKIQLWKGKEKLKIDLTIEGCFKAPEDMADDEFEKMLNVNGTAALYSIARSFVLSNTSQVLLDGKVILPMVNVVEYSRSNEKTKE